MTIRDAITGRVVGETFDRMVSGTITACNMFCAEWRNQSECRRDLIISIGGLSTGWAFKQEADARHELMAWDLERVGQEEK